MSYPFERILLATEHTDFDVGAERVAFEMARHCGLPLAGVLPLVSNPEYEIVAPQLVAAAERDAHGRLETLLAAARDAGVALDMHIRRGEEPYREIVGEARDRGSDLIVARRRGKRSFFANLLVGEMVGKVAAHAPCSVLLVPRAANMWSKRLLAAVDGSPISIRVCESAAAIARQCDLPLTVVGVAAGEAGDARQRIDRAVAEGVEIVTARGGVASGMVRVGKPFEQILAAGREVGADLVVIGRRGDSGIAHAVLGGTGQKVVGLAETPVLVVAG